MRMVHGREHVFDERVQAFVVFGDVLRRLLQHRVTIGGNWVNHIALLAKYDCKIMAALTRSTVPLSWRSFFLSPPASIAFWAMLEVKRSSTVCTGIPGNSFCSLRTKPMTC